MDEIIIQRIEISAETTTSLKMKNNAANIHDMKYMNTTTHRTMINVKRNFTLVILFDFYPLTDVKLGLICSQLKTTVIQNDF